MVYQQQKIVVKEQTLDKYCIKNATLKAVHPENGKLSVSGNQR